MQGPSKGRVPNAYEINPQMMEMLDSITPQNLPMILMSNPELVPEKHMKAIKKSVKNGAILALEGFLIGSALNFFVKKVYIKFLAFPVYVRIPLRLGIFALPFGFFYGKIMENGENIGQNLAIIHMKLQRLRKTGNIEEYFKV